MTQPDLYQKLVDLYTGDELPEELTEELETAAFTNPEIANEMRTLRATYRELKALPVPRFGEESFHRILLKLYAGGADLEMLSPTPAFMQYQLPMSG